MVCKQLGPKQLAWLKELESGEYYQASGNLIKKSWGKNTSQQQYCCLGILAKTIYKNSDSEIKIFDKRYQGKLPDRIWIDIGLRSGTGEFRLPPGTQKFKTNSDLLKKIASRDIDSLASMNDQGTPFNKIAQFIRDNYEYIFNKSV